MIKQIEFEGRIKKRFPEENFTIIEYNGAGRLLKIQCDKCKNIIEVNSASNFLAKNKRYGCKNCHGLWKERENKLEAIKEKYDIIDIIPEKKSNGKKQYTIKCKNCGHIRTSYLGNLYRHLDCGCQTGVLRKRTGEEFIKEVNEKNQDHYELVGEYKDQTTKVLIRHSCGFVWNARPADLVDGRKHTCPRCQRQYSYGIRIISNFLQSKGIVFEREKLLKNTRLRFDIFLPSFNMAIEYQGKQHYFPISYFGGEENFKKQQDRDNRKRQFCKENNIILLEIPYTLKKEEIEEVLSKNLQGSTTKVVQVNEKSARLLQDDDIVSSQEETLERLERDKNNKLI